MRVGATEKLGFDPAAPELVARGLPAGAEGASLAQEQVRRTGPFYIVWEQGQTARISSEYWAYQLAALRYVPGPAARWPQIVVHRSLPPNQSPSRACSADTNGTALPEGAAGGHDPERDRALRERRLARHIRSPARFQINTV
jgi:hypothetical protein